MTNSNGYIYILAFCFIFYMTSTHAQEEVKNPSKYEYATFAGGCFWTMQYDFDQVKGVDSTIVGYIGGQTANPSYEQVLKGNTGHAEAVQIKYNPSVVSYRDLLNIYWHNIDPTRNDGQFCDKGNEYRPVIFYYSEAQKKLAKKYKNELVSENRINPILVDILPATTFYAAEEYHQEYYKKNPVRYKNYRENCGRDNRLKEIWGASK